MWDAIFIVNSVPNKVEIPIKRWIRYHVLQEKQGREVKLAMKTTSDGVFRWYLGQGYRKGWRRKKWEAGLGAM